ncbi:MAG: hypothetical protein K9L66_09815 [Spirochaetaceae bacterium]|nr:hypothetical protein [Spirochaetaceae bacterium]MCF7949704.1 hypothetical protein [Spirochaetia bacterium]MCF7951801.1 hypothetical protein [Spirochaetaceae bacterium]
MQSSVILLKEKYGLAHIPSRHKAEKWAHRVGVLLQQGYSEEQAGMEAAKQVFSYEYKEVYVRSGASVSDILAGL